MSATSFLFNGSPPADVNTITSDTSQLPAWYQQYLSGLLGTADTIAAQPFPQYNGPQLADFNSTQNTAFTQAGNIGQAGAASTTGAQGALTNATNTNIPGAVAPYAASSTAQATPQGIQSYMSPYLNNQIAGINTLAQQNWNQFTAPSVNNSFIGAGQFGSGRNAEVMGQQANLANQATTAQIAAADQSAYNTAGTQAATQAGILQGAGSMMGTANQQQGALQTAAGSALGALGSTQQSEAAQQAAANQAVGNQQQAQTQSNLNLAYQQFEQQAMWPQQQAEFMNQIVQGLPSPGTSASTSANTPASPFTTFSPAQVASPTLSTLFAGGVGSPGSPTGLKGGGRVSHRGGALSHIDPNAMRAQQTPDGGMYIPKGVLLTLASRLAQSKMGSQPSAQMQPGARPPMQPQMRPQLAAAPQGMPPQGALSQMGAM